MSNSFVCSKCRSTDVAVALKVDRKDGNNVYYFFHHCMKCEHHILEHYLDDTAVEEDGLLDNLMKRFTWGDMYNNEWLYTNLKKPVDEYNTKVLNCRYQFLSSTKTDNLGYQLFDL